MLAPRNDVLPARNRDGVLSIAEIQQLALLPSKEELISKIMFLVQAPTQRIASAMSAVTRNLAVTVQEAAKAEKFSQ